MADYKPVRALERGLDVLRALNLHNGVSVQHLARKTGIHRTTVQRLLETLRAQGYVKKSASDESYRLALGVRRLSEGFNDDAWVASAAEPLLAELHQKVLWPANLATLDVDAMTIRESTHRHSPFSIHHATVGQRLPMLRTALGQVYLGHCPQSEREEILALLASSRGPDAALARDAAFVREMVRRVRGAGYAAKVGDQEKRIGALAVPVMRGARVFATLNIVFFRTALTLPSAVAKYLAPLRQTAEAIAQRMNTARLWPEAAETGAEAASANALAEAANHRSPRTAVYMPPADNRRPRSRIAAYVDR